MDGRKQKYEILAEKPSVKIHTWKKSEKEMKDYEKKIQNWKNNYIKIKKKDYEEIIEYKEKNKLTGSKKLIKPVKGGKELQKKKKN